MNDREHPFFRPLWRRVALVVFCAAWTAWEYYNQEELWGMIALGMTAYGAYTFLWAYREPAAPATKADDPKE
jgi:hypothetical protein